MNFEDIQERREIRCPVGVWILDRVADAGLGGDMDDAFRPLPFAECLDRRAIGEIELGMNVTSIVLETCEPRPLERDIVVVVHLVDADDFVSAGEQRLGHRRTNEAGRARYQDLHPTTIRINRFPHVS